jgi:hypothetical protein
MSGSYKPKVKDKVHTPAGDVVTDGYGNPQTTTFPEELLNQNQTERDAKAPTSPAVQRRKK